MVVVCKYLIPKGYAAMALFPFIVLSGPEYKNDAVLLNHESIHLRQQAELLVVPFYIWYILEYFARRVANRPHRIAYKKICFEAEAYANETSPDYLLYRKPYAFLRYLQ